MLMDFQESVIQFIQLFKIDAQYIKNNQLSNLKLYHIVLTLSLNSQDLREDSMGRRIFER